MAYFESNDHYETGQSVNHSVENILQPGEKIIWTGKPNRKAYILNAFFHMLPIALIWGVLDGFFISMIITAGIFETNNFLLFIIIPFFLIHLIPFWMWLLGVLSSGRKQKNTEYVLTDTRILISEKFKGTDFKSIYYIDIASLDLRSGVIDKLFKVSDIIIQSKSKKAQISDLDNALEAYNLIQKNVAAAQKI